ncbi:MAG: hypothetical protein QXI23_00850 [Candidatus Aenigmatarchaeota archaeon]
MKKQAVIEDKNPNKKLLRKKEKITEKIGNPKMKTKTVKKIPWLKNS